LSEAFWLPLTVATLVPIATSGQDMILFLSRSVAQRPINGHLHSDWRHVGHPGQHTHVTAADDPALMMARKAAYLEA